MLNEYVRERLAHLLAEQAPRRAQPTLVSRASTQPGAPVAGDGRARRGLSSGDGPDFEPSEDDEALEGRRIGARQPPDGLGQPPDGLGQPFDRPGQSPVGPAQPPVPAQTAPSRPFAAGLLDQDRDSVDAPGRRRFSRGHLGVVCALLLVGLLCAGWGVLRARPVAIASTPFVSASPGPASTALTKPTPPAAGEPGAASPASPTQILVHVLGAVQRPGVVRLPERSRVQDAIESAGGLRKEAVPGDLNLAAVLDDGQQLVIGTAKKPSVTVRDDSSGPGSTAGPATDGSSAGVVNLNSASQVLLEGLPGVGPVTAAKIVAWRDQNGRFSRVEELQEVDGIGPKTYADIAPHVRV